MLMPHSVAYALNSRWNPAGTLKFIGVKSVDGIFSRLPTVLTGSGSAPFRESFRGTLATVGRLSAVKFATKSNHRLN